MKIHEYQAKSLLSQYGIPVPKGGTAKTGDEAERIAREIGRKVAIKAQFHAGGRGKAGGIKIADSPDEAGRIAAGLVGKNLVTQQTGPQGLTVKSVLVEEAIEVERELYLGIAVDSTTGVPVIMASEVGGMEIEEISRTNPGKILKSYVDPCRGFFPYQARGLAFGMNLKGEQFEAATGLIPSLYRLFRDKDCSLAEINPLAVTADGRLLALDAKVNIDDNALFRQPDIAEMRDPSQEDPLEADAKSKDIEYYVKLNGNIGIVVNGAGLAMAVMDTIKLAGGEPANFLDIGTVNRSGRVGWYSSSRCYRFRAGRCSEGAWGQNAPYCSEIGRY
jgi:succinyl-CoA synthetase beta subunit